jgi:hypothetical protein
MAEFGSRGATAAGLTTGIIGTSLGALNSGMLGNLFGGNNNHCCGENTPVNRYELQMQHDLAAKDGEIALLKSNIYVDGKIADVYERLNTKIGVIENQLCEQKVYNAAQTAAMNCMGSQIAQLFSLTKLIVPNSSFCPGFGNVTVSPATAATTSTAAVI